MTGDRLAQVVEEHVRAALQRSEPDFSPFPVDSWSEPAGHRQWVVLEDDDGRRSQVMLDHLIVRGIAIAPGRISGQCRALVDAVLVELRGYVAGGPTVVSRPMPDPPDALHVVHLEFRGAWLRLSVGYDAGSPVAVLAALLGKGPVALADPVESVVWL